MNRPPTKRNCFRSQKKVFLFEALFREGLLLKQVNLGVRFLKTVSNYCIEIRIFHWFFSVFLIKISQMISIEFLSLNPFGTALGAKKRLSKILTRALTSRYFLIVFFKFRSYPVFNYQESLTILTGLFFKYIVIFKNIFYGIGDT